MEIIGPFVLAVNNGNTNCFFCCRILQDACLNMEHMLSVLKLEPEITDAPNATELKVPKGEISFNQVYFRHNPR